MTCVHVYVSILARVAPGATIAPMRCSAASALSGEWCPLCYSGRKGRAVYPGHWGSVAGRRKTRYGWVVLKRSRPGGPDAAGVSSLPAECPLSKRLPTVMEFLSLQQWEDGGSRARGTIRLFWEAGAYKACCNDKDGKCYAFTSAKTFTGLLEALEKGLAAGTMDWRPDREWQGKAPRKGGRDPTQ